MKRLNPSEGTKMSRIGPESLYNSYLNIMLKMTKLISKLIIRRVHDFLFEAESKLFAIVEI